MKAITIWQPWASLIMAGHKPYEFRRWPAPKALVGQRIVIHAGARRVVVREIAELLEQLGAGHPCGGLNSDCSALLGKLLSAPHSLPYSAGLGTVVLGSPQMACDLWPDEFKDFSDSDRVEHSNWAWPLTKIEHFTPIVPTPGRQGFWQWPWTGAAQ